MSETSCAIDIPQGIKSAQLSAVVTRLCRCAGEPVPDANGKLVSSCGHPPMTENRGVVAYYHRNPLMRLWYWVRGVRGRFSKLPSRT